MQGPPYSGAQGVKHERWYADVNLTNPNAMLTVPATPPDVSQVLSNLELPLDLEETRPFIERLSTIVPSPIQRDEGKIRVSELLLTLALHPEQLQQLKYFKISQALKPGLFCS